jgi:hypothetical protein
MRTTFNLDDEVLGLVRQYAESRSLALGKAVSELVQRGLRAPLATKVVNGIVVFDIPPDSPPISSEHVRKLESELE